MVPISAMIGVKSVATAPPFWRAVPIPATPRERRVPAAVEATAVAVQRFTSVRPLVGFATSVKLVAVPLIAVVTLPTIPQIRTGPPTTRKIASCAVAGRTSAARRRALRGWRS